MFFSRSDFRKRFHSIFSPGHRALQPDRSHKGGVGQPTILILADADRATMKLYFETPILAMREAGYSFVLFTEQSLSRPAWSPRATKELFDNIQPNLVLFSRLGSERGLMFLEEAKKRKVRTLYHLDDDLLGVPESLGAEIHAKQAARHVVSIRTALISNCDAILVSTQELLNVMKARFSQSKMYIGPRPPFLPIDPKPWGRDKNLFKIGYMGSRGHQRDLAEILPSLISVMKRHPHVHFETFGTISMPSDLKQFDFRVRDWPALTDYSAFQTKLASLQWDLGIAPLLDDQFNRCKTPIKFLEYTAAGIPVLASNSIVYQLKDSCSSLQLINADGWEGALENVLRNPDDLAAMTNRAYKYCQTEFALEKTKRDLEMILQDVIGEI